MVKPSETIARDRERIVRFRDVLQRLLASENGDGDDDLVSEVSVAAGEARRAYARNDGRSFAVQDGICLVPNADPMSHWASLVSANSDLNATKVITSLDLAIGRAQVRFEDAQRNERGVVGVVSAIFRWPTTLRNAVGPSLQQQRAAQTLGILGQIVVAAVGPTLSAAIVQAAVILWQTIFAG
ncbi:hypothetical protein [Conyzicola nivalis]|nr:hypothetical protein [Conyzicola nivalis]